MIQGEKKGTLKQEDKFIFLGFFKFTCTHTHSISNILQPELEKMLKDLQIVN